MVAFRSVPATCVALVGACAVVSHAFVSIPGAVGPAREASSVAVAELRGTHMGQGNDKSAVGVGFAMGLLVAGISSIASSQFRAQQRRNKTAARYTTQQIIPELVWLKTGFVEKDLGPGDLRSITIAGLDLCIGKTEDNVIFAVGDKMPPTGTSLSVGGELEGNLVVEPQFGSKFDVFSGEPVEWCPSPIGTFVGAFMGGPSQIAVIEIRSSFFGGDVEVLVDLAAKRAYEANYWKGILDAQGKNDGTWY